MEFVGEAAAAESLNLGKKVSLDPLHGHVQAAGVAGLGDVVAGAERQGVQGGAGAALGQRAEHDDGQLWMELANLGDGLQAGHVRHFHVEGDEVGT